MPDFYQDVFIVLFIGKMAAISSLIGWRYEYGGHSGGSIGVDRLPQAGLETTARIMESILSIGLGQQNKGQVGLTIDD